MELSEVPGATNHRSGRHEVTTETRIDCASIEPRARRIDRLDELAVRADGRRDRRGSGGLLEDVHTARRAETDHVGEADLGALHLAIPASPRRWWRLRRYWRCRSRRSVALGNQAARDIDRRAAVAERRTGVDEVTGPAGSHRPRLS